MVRSDGGGTSSDPHCCFFCLFFLPFFLTKSNKVFIQVLVLGVLGLGSRLQEGLDRQFQQGGSGGKVHSLA